VPAPTRASALAAAATVLALVSAWHSGRHMWHRLQQDRATYAPLTGEQRARAPLTAIPLPADVFDWYASLLTRGDRVYYQVEPSGFSHSFDLPTIVEAAGRYYLLPSVQVTDPKRATVVVSYMADPRFLHLHFVTQQQAGAQPIFVSRIATP
jgi:hypothetical protein